MLSNGKRKGLNTKKNIQLSFPTSETELQYSALKLMPRILTAQGRSGTGNGKYNPRFLFDGFDMQHSLQPLTTSTHPPAYLAKSHIVVD